MTWGFSFSSLTLPAAGLPVNPSNPRHRGLVSSNKPKTILTDLASCLVRWAAGRLPKDSFLNQKHNGGTRGGIVHASPLSGGELSSLGAEAKLEMGRARFETIFPPNASVAQTSHQPRTSTSHRSDRQEGSSPCASWPAWHRKPPNGKNHMKHLPQIISSYKCIFVVGGWWLWAEVDLVRGRMSGSVAQSPPLSLPPWDCLVGTSGVGHRSGGWLL